MKELNKFMRRINYNFNSLELLEAALTHRSVRGKNNERLEFLGDAVLNLIIAEVLFHKFPNAREGELSRLRAFLVKGETLAKLANEFNLSGYLRVGPGEVKSGGAQRESILADAIEAIIGAIYLDAGFPECKKQVLNWFTSRLSDMDLLKNLKDPKTLLQEYLQFRKYPLPHYNIVSVKGESHAQMFSVECRVEGLNLVSQGEGRSRRKAEQDAAYQLLLKLEEKDLS